MARKGRKTKEAADEEKIEGLSPWTSKKFEKRQRGGTDGRWLNDGSQVQRTEHWSLRWRAALLGNGNILSRSGMSNLTLGPARKDVTLTQR